MKEVLSKSKKTLPIILLQVLLILLFASRPLAAQMTPRGELVSWCGKDQIEIDGEIFNNETMYLDAYGNWHNERNCYDLEARRGPIFVATISYLETDETTERYFILVDAKDGTVVRKYLDEIVAAKKKGIQAIAMEKKLSSKPIFWSVILSVLILVVLAIFILIMIMLKRSRIG